MGVVKFFDGFGDADRNNDGVINDADTDTQTNGIGTYIPARGSNPDPNPDPLIDDRATNPEVGTALDSGDTGLRWLSHSGFTGANNGDRRAFIAIVDDTQGSMLETKPTTTVGGLATTAINNGYALSYNSKGRGNSAAAFFDETISLGPEVGDQVKVSFDFRVWRDAPNANAVEQPDDADIRFGLFQDTDNQLGLTNPVAGKDTIAPVTQTPAVWGQEDGYFDGTRGSLPASGSNIGSTNDRGWYGSVILENPVGSFPPIIPNGGGWRIREETNVAGTDTNDKRIMQGTGDLDTVAVPQPMTPGGTDYGLVNLDVRKVYNLSLTLERATDVTPGDTIKAILTATDRATGISYSLMDQESLFNDDGMGGMIPDGISSDSWDYFAIRNTGIDDVDLVLDNFKLEIFGSNAGIAGDFDGDGDVDGRDFLVWQRGGSPSPFSPGDLAAWQGAYNGGALAAVSAVPEPSALLLLSLGGLLAGGIRKRVIS
ncbi:MAG: PEP-CTERM sorting domain-containing protein [Bythopirellula sp.]|nr:PEP-CTERM sorting domain-containing protein [Bythopirellula sp.]